MHGLANVKIDQEYVWILWTPKITHPVCNSPSLNQLAPFQNAIIEKNAFLTNMECKKSFEGNVTYLDTEL